MMKVAKEKKFKREYVPVIVLALILILLLVILILVFMWEKKDFNIRVPEEEYIANEILVDTSNSACSESTVSKLYQDFSEVEFKWTPVEIERDNGADQTNNQVVKTKTYVFDVTFDNVTEDMYIIIENDNRRTEKDRVKLTYADAKDGKITYRTEHTELVITYTVSIYAAKYECKDELFRKFTFQTPIYNRWSDIDICENYPKFDYCKKFLTTHVPTDDMFFTELHQWGEKNKIKITNFYDTLDIEKEDFYDYLPDHAKEVYDKKKKTTTTSQKITKKTTTVTTKKAGN